MRDFVKNSGTALQILAYLLAQTPPLQPRADGHDLCLREDGPVMVWERDDELPIHHPVELASVPRKGGGVVRFVATEEAVAEAGKAITPFYDVSN